MYKLRKVWYNIIKGCTYPKFVKEEVAYVCESILDGSCNNNTTIIVEVVILVVAVAISMHNDNKKKNGGK